MRRLIYEILFGRNAAVSGAIAGTVVLSFVLGCNCAKNLVPSNTSNSTTPSNSSSSNSGSNDTPKVDVPPNAIVEQLVVDTMDEFADAVSSGDFTTLYNDASTDFRQTYTLDEVKTGFKTYTDKKSLVLPILRKIPGTRISFDRQPTVRTEKGLNILMASGKFPTKPYNVRFDYEYVLREGNWKLLKLVINIP